MITVDEIMTTKVFTLQPTHTVADARQLMATKHIHHIPVLDSGDLVGLVSDRDLLMATHSALAKPRKKNNADAGGDIPLQDVMTTSVATVSPQAGLRQAAIYLAEHKYGCLPVVDDGKLVGIVTDTDFIAVAVNLLEQVELRESGSDETFEEEPEDIDIEDLDLPLDETRDWD